MGVFSVDEIDTFEEDLYEKFSPSHLAHVKENDEKKLKSEIYLYNRKSSLIY